MSRLDQDREWTYLDLGHFDPAKRTGVLTRISLKPSGRILLSSISVFFSYEGGCPSDALAAAPGNPLKQKIIKIITVCVSQRGLKAVSVPDGHDASSIVGLLMDSHCCVSVR